MYDDDPPGPGRHDLGQVVGVDPTDGEPGSPLVLGGVSDEVQAHRGSTGLGRGLPYRADADVVGLGRSRIQLISRVRGESDDRVGPQDFPSHFHGKIVLAEVHAVGIQGQGYVGPVVHDEQRTVPFGHLTEDLPAADDVPGLRVLLSDLYGIDPRLKNSIEEPGKILVVRSADQVQARATERPSSRSKLFPFAVMLAITTRGLAR